jgi:hypothetical protein
MGRIVQLGHPFKYYLIIRRNICHVYHSPVAFRRVFCGRNPMKKMVIQDGSPITTRGCSYFLYIVVICCPGYKSSTRGSSSQPGHGCWKRYNCNPEASKRNNLKKSSAFADVNNQPTPSLRLAWQGAKINLRPQASTSTDAPFQSNLASDLRLAAHTLQV